MKKYLVYGGYVESKNDGQTHYITSRQLIDLYGVNPIECVCLEFHEFEKSDLSIEAYKRSKVGYTDDLIVLDTREDGDYTLPKTYKD